MGGGALQLGTVDLALPGHVLQTSGDYTGSEDRYLSRPDIVHEPGFSFYVHFSLRHLSVYSCMYTFVVLGLVSSVPG